MLFTLLIIKVWLISLVNFNKLIIVSLTFTYLLPFLKHNSSFGFFKVLGQVITLKSKLLFK
jgi:hypothetical protein